MCEEADRIVNEEENPGDIHAEFLFPDAERKDWLIPLNIGNEASLTYLFYARAEDQKRGKVIDLLYEVPVYYKTGIPKRDENGEIIWKCIAYDSGLGWQIVAEENSKK